MSMRMNMYSDDAGREFKRNLIELCKNIDRKDLAAKLELGEDTPGHVLMDIAIQYKRDDLMAMAKLTLLAEKFHDSNKLPHQNPSRLGREVPEDPLKYMSLAEMLEAQAHGISNETYVHNKSLPMYQRLKLPVWEAIFSLNYKEKVHEGK